MTLDIVSFVIGVLVGGVACAVSAKVFGFFNKQVTSIKKDV